MEDDRQLIARTLNGDRNAFGRLVERYQAQVYALAFHMVGGFADAEDVVQETFIKAYQHLPRFGGTMNFPAWLRTIALNECRMWLRGQRRFVPRDPWSESDRREVRDESPTPEERYEQVELSEQVAQAIHALSEPNRLAVMLYYMDGLSYEEIGQFLEVPVSTVKGRLHKARRQLKEGTLQMVAQELGAHSLPKDFPRKIQALLDRPRPLQHPDHPLTQIWDQVRAALPDYEVVEGPEILSTTDHFDALLTPSDHPSQKDVYYVDEGHVLRSHTTPVLSMLLRGRTPPLKIVTAGRAFRDGTEDAHHLQVFHQIELAEVGEEVTAQGSMDVVKRVLRHVLGDVEVRFSPATWPFTDPGWEVAVQIEGTWRDVAGMGMMKPGVLQRVGLDPVRVCYFGAGIGIERLAMLKFGIEDIRELWRT